MTKRLTAIVYNTISHGHWNEPAHGFNVSFSANGTPLIPQIGNPQWITGGRYIHYLAHRGIRTCRIWLRFDDNSLEQIWYYQTDQLDRKLLIAHNLSDALLPVDVVWD